ncbi:MAG TPA: hypothetical protein DD400_04250, partial [Rhodospirillaceae bacterium]|nr:hypothetical protein [Rhodospirillaceae bacterium]
MNNAQYILAKIDGGAVNQIAKDRFPKAKGLSLSEMSTNIDVIESVITGKADFAVDDATSFMGYMKNNPNKIKRFFDEAVGVFPAVMLL